MSRTGRLKQIQIHDNGGEPDIAMDETGNARRGLYKLG